MRRLTLLALCLLARAGGAEDCNGNGSTDAEDLASGSSADCNSNGRPDECDLAATSFAFVMDWFAEVGAPAGVASADLNRDGWPDVAATLGESQEVAVLPGEEGGFPVTSYFPVSLAPESIRLADLDGDGDVDAATATSDGLSVLWNDGAGGFTSEVALRVDQGPLAAHAADLESPSPDQDLDRVPDECAGSRFRRGDADADGGIGLTDAVFLLEHLFRGGRAPACEKASDANDDGTVDVADPVSLLEHLFRGGQAPPAPHGACGLDATPDALTCEVSCA